MIGSGIPSLDGQELDNFCRLYHIYQRRCFTWHTVTS